MWAVCANTECQNYQWPMDIGDMTTTDPESGNVITIANVACGPCGQVITDVTETKPPDPPDPEDPAANTAPVGEV